jgi:hypothetical protein
MDLRTGQLRCDIGVLADRVRTAGAQIREHDAVNRLPVGSAPAPAPLPHWSLLARTTPSGPWCPGVAGPIW